MGGRTGSHQTGHGETYWSKFKEVIDHGYIPLEDANDLRLLPQGWRMPADGDWEHLIAEAKRK